jgi:hypothetical protein
MKIVVISLISIVVLVMVFLYTPPKNIIIRKNEEERYISKKVVTKKLKSKSKSEEIYKDKLHKMIKEQKKNIGSITDIPRIPHNCNHEERSKSLIRNMDKTTPQYKNIKRKVEILEVKLAQLKAQIDKYKNTSTSASTPIKLQKTVSIAHKKLILMKIEFIALRTDHHLLKAEMGDLRYIDPCILEEKDMPKIFKEYEEGSKLFKTKLNSHIQDIENIPENVDGITEQVHQYIKNIDMGADVVLRYAEYIEEARYRIKSKLLLKSIKNK